MAEVLDRLKTRLADVNNLYRASAVLGWDQQTYMPPGGAEARGEQLATISRLAHEIFSAPETGELLAAAADEVESLPAESVPSSLVRVAQRDYELAVKVPQDLIAEIRRHNTRAHQIWVEAREKQDFTIFQPCLERTVELSRELAEYLGYEEHPYDALLDEYEPGMRASQVQSIFATLKQELVPLVAAISERLDHVDDSVLHQTFDEAKQEAFGRMIITRFGYDFTRGRQDRTIHPFETTFSRNDVRITTRFEPDFLNPALFGTFHEAGHGLYEQGVSEDLEGTLLARGASLGLHESQSRMWENVVGRSRRFWTFFFPLLQETFPEQFSTISLDTFYGAINRVHPSFVRVEADEVTYNLHIMLRFEMEMEMLTGAYPVSEARTVWNDRMQSYLGITPPNDTLGILQDVHWTSTLGYFPTYSLGNILSIQLFETALAEKPEILSEIESGRFDTLRAWLTDRVYHHGRIFEPVDLIERVTGEPLQSRSYMRYLRTKYGEIYGLEMASGS